MMQIISNDTKLAARLEVMDTTMRDVELSEDEVWALVVDHA